MNKCYKPKKIDWSRLHPDAYYNKWKIAKPYLLRSTKGSTYFGAGILIFYYAPPEGFGNHINLWELVGVYDHDPVPDEFK